MLQQVPSEICAMKVLKKTDIIKAKRIEHVVSEHSIMSFVQHPFIVRLVDAYQDDKNVYLVQEFLPGSDLYHHIKRLGPLPQSTAVFYAAEVASLFAYLHESKIAYRDLKPENLVLAANGYAKLIDFGFAKRVEWKTFTLCGTPDYLAPEMLSSKGHNQAVDWWCLGILLYEMLAGETPFAAPEPLQIYQNIMKGDIRFPAHFSESAKSLLRHLLTADTTRRYGCLKDGAMDVLRHRVCTVTPEPLRH